MTPIPSFSGDSRILGMVAYAPVHLGVPGMKRSRPLYIITGAWFDVVHETLAGLSTSERDAVLHGTACSVYAA